MLSQLTKTLVVVVAGAASASLLLLWFRKNKEEDDILGETTKTSRHAMIKIRIPKKYVGYVIGRQGATIKAIQQETNTKINFENKVEDDYRIVTIRGLPEDVPEAEKRILKFIHDQSVVETYEMFVPKKACGKIIGRNGDNIRYMSQLSKAKILVDRIKNTKNELTRIIIRGAVEQINVAKTLIEEIVVDVEDEEKKSEFLPEREKKMQLSIMSQVDETQPYRKDCLQTESLIPTASDGYLEIFVSAVNNPGQFWVQVIGTRAIELDKMVEQLTEYYSQLSNQNLHKLQQVQVGDIIAAPFRHDQSWYRAKVTNVEEESYSAEEKKISVYYVDFGDSEDLILQDVCILAKRFLHLPFQAIECSLAKVKPKDNIWIEEAILLFEQLTHAAQWKVLMAKPLRTGQPSENSNNVAPLELVDTTESTEIHIADELVRQGFAVWTQD